MIPPLLQFAVAKLGTRRLSRNPMVGCDILLADDVGPEEINPESMYENET